MSSSAKSSAARFGALGFMAVALGCAAFAAYLVGHTMSSKYTGTRVVPVVVASHALHAGTTLGKDDLEVREWPEDAAPKQSFASVEALLDKHGGATVTVGILAGEPVVGSRLSSSATGTGIAALVRPNMRAFALKVNDSVGFTGLVYPGAYVNVVATVRDPFGRGPSSRIAVQNARVLSLGMDSDVATRKVRETEEDKLSGKPQNGGTFVTLEVTPEESEILAVAKAEGRIDLVLRNATDDADVDTTGATPDSFSAFATSATGVPATAAAAQAPPARGHRQIHRKKRSIQIIAADDSDTPTSKSRPAHIETYNAN